MKKQIAIVLFMTMTLVSAWSGPAKAEELKLKSEPVAWVLALDPIPGDALFYGGKTSQGVVNTVLGIGAGALTIFGGVLVGAFGSSDGRELLLIGSGVAYFSLLLWDGIGGIRGVHKHNERVRQKTSLLQSIQPVVSVLPDGGYAGVQFRW
jgi:hypothetical protein